MVAAVLLLHVTLAFPSRTLPPLTLRAAVAEAAAICSSRRLVTASSCRATNCGRLK